MKTVFQGALVYDSTLRQFHRADIETKDGIITNVTEPNGTAVSSAETAVIPCEGLAAVPGLVDVHTHGRAGFDFNTANAKEVAVMQAAYAKAGTTTVMATLASASRASLFASIDAVKTARENTKPGVAFLAGIHLEGRYLNPVRRGAHAKELLAPLSPDEVEEFLRAIAPLPAHVSAACELPGGEAFVKRAVSLGATCGMAHSDATYDEALAAVAWGVTSFTHTFNAMRPIHHREPGNAMASLLCDGAYTELICDGEHVHPAMIALAHRLKPKDKLVLITDSMEATGCSDGTYEIAGLKVFVKNGRAVNEDGALAGSTLDLFRALLNYMNFCGIPLEEALPAATSNPAAMMGLSSVCGAIKPGLRADFLLLDNLKDPHIQAVFAGGVKI